MTHFYLGKQVTPDMSTWIAFCIPKHIQPGHGLDIKILFTYNGAIYVYMVRNVALGRNWRCLQVRLVFARDVVMWHHKPRTTVSTLCRRSRELISVLHRSCYVDLVRAVCIHWTNYRPPPPASITMVAQSPVAATCLYCSPCDHMCPFLAAFPFI